MKHLVASLLCCSAALYAQAQAQPSAPEALAQAAGPPALTPEILAEISEFERFLEETPDPVGTGNMPSEKLADPAVSMKAVAVG